MVLASLLLGGGWRGVVPVHPDCFVINILKILYISIVTGKDCFRGTVLIAGFFTLQAVIKSF